ncbi:TspO_MBR domain-containing protein [Cephalotus follicularis]|uniref:TspO_MBR domain-containing protein n=1 Tax=Cephalotus follicularis TaxID=3775 RepID=A0A1Q3C123_CEPFO|nr:TspO_MBR domain-containing protein [Cephalotus follicularis]
MASQDLKQRIRDDDPQTTTTMNNKSNNKSTKRDRRVGMAKRGLRSLSVAVLVPLSLTLINIYLFGSTHTYGDLVKPFWFPPFWLLHATCIVSSSLMGLSAWLIWAEGGFHNNPMALSLYLAQLTISLAWDPIVFQMGASWIGLVMCLAMFGALVGCSRVFREVNPIAADLVMLCSVWAAFLAIVNLTLVFL